MVKSRNKHQQETYPRLQCSFYYQSKLQAMHYKGKSSKTNKKPYILASSLIPPQKNGSVLMIPGFRNHPFKIDSHPTLPPDRSDQCLPWLVHGGIDLLWPTIVPEQKEPLSNPTSVWKPFFHGEKRGVSFLAAHELVTKWATTLWYSGFWGSKSLLI